MQARQSPSGPAIKLLSFPGEQANINVGNAASIDWSRGPGQSLGLFASCNVTSRNLPAGQAAWVQLKIVQAGGGGGFVPTFVGAKTPGGTPLTFSAAPGSIDLVWLYWDGFDLFATVEGRAFA